MARVLNLGCGDDFYGDVRADVFKTKATTHVFDLNKKFPLKSNDFDEIYCKSVLEHIRNLGTFVDECHRVLKKGGKIFIRTDHAGFILAYILKRHESNHGLEIQYNAGAFGHKQSAGENEDHHYALFVESHLRYLFNKFKHHRFNYYYGGSNKLKNFIYKLMPKRTGACHIEMIAYK